MIRSVNITRASFFGVILFFSLLFTFVLKAQIRVKSSTRENTVPVPSNERFDPALDLITVNGSSNNEGIFGDTVRLYDKDGQLWFEYGFLESSPLFHGNFRTPHLDLVFSDNLRVYKLIAVSKSWYEVEVDVKSGESKFMRIGDPFLKRDPIELRLVISPYILFDEQKNPLREAVNGRIIDYSKSDNYYFKAAAAGVDGDWLQVEMLPRNSNEDLLSRKGWIRWKLNQKLLVQFGYR